MIRFFVGGVVVSVFAALAEIFRPKSFAGLFGAAPSIALATARHYDRSPRQSLRGHRSSLDVVRRDCILLLRKLRQLDTHAGQASRAADNHRADSSLVHGLFCAVVRDFSDNPMMVQAKFGALKGIKPHEFAIRFAFGGLVCVAAGLIAKSFGPGIGGLFLAFPAIFPAGASLVESHEKMHKARAGFDGTRRGRAVASIDAAGAAIGCIGLAGFAIVLWTLLTSWNTYAVFMLASLVWLTASVGCWMIRKSRVFRG